MTVTSIKPIIPCLISLGWVLWEIRKQIPYPCFIIMIGFYIHAVHTDSSLVIEVTIKREGYLPCSEVET